MKGFSIIFGITAIILSSCLQVDADAGIVIHYITATGKEENMIVRPDTCNNIKEPANVIINQNPYNLMLFFGRNCQGGEAYIIEPYGVYHGSSTRTISSVIFHE
jgi:hypothetical protein